MKLAALLLGLIIMASAYAAPVKEPDNVDVNGNSGSTSFVYDGITGHLRGFVRFSTESKCLMTTWVIQGAEPGYQYQLKLHSKGTDARLADVTSDSALSGTDSNGDSYLVMDIQRANSQGIVAGAVKECRLPDGIYDNTFFAITENQAPWPSSSTWRESTADSLASLSIV